MTGQPVAPSSQPVASTRLEAGGLAWAYRSVPASPGAAAPGKLPVLCVHGLGSSSYSYRNLLRLLAEKGHDVYAVDLPGHGGSAKPPPSAFAYSEAAYVAALGDFVAALGLAGPFALVVQGYVTGQYGLMYALEAGDALAKLVILNTPLGVKGSKLRPELAAYKSPLPFMRPKAGAAFDAANYNAAGGPYALARRDADAYEAPYADPAASAAVAATMACVDFPALLARVDDGYQAWRKPALVLHGANDQFLDMKTAFEWLDSKRTCIRLATGIEDKLGHMPQEDYAEAIAGPIADFLAAAE